MDKEVGEMIEDKAEEDKDEKKEDEVEEDEDGKELGQGGRLICDKREVTY